MRRSGRTTRQIDEAVQELFDKGKVTWRDHASLPTNTAQHHGWMILMRRLYNEHGLSRSNLNITANRGNWTIKLRQS